MSRRYLAVVEVQQALARGKAVEQWLGARNEPAGRVISWLRIDKESDGRFGVTRFDAYDPATTDLFDVYSFPPFDIDAPFGTSTILSSIADAIAYARTELGADPTRFVNAGVVQDEYRDFLGASRSG